MSEAAAPARAYEYIVVGSGAGGGTLAGYRPATTWADALPRQVEWLIAATKDRDWREVLPRGAQYLRFDYAGEEASG